MAHIESTRFGPIEVDEELLFVFPRGIPGFEEARKFVVVEREGQAFKWLQSADVPNLAFLIADPHYFLPDYEAEIPQGEMNVLNIRFPEDLALAVILNVPPAHPERLTVNLRAPLIFNIRERLGLQVILTSSKYVVDYAVIREWRRRTIELEESRQVDAGPSLGVGERTVRSAIEGSSAAA